MFTSTYLQFKLNGIEVEEKVLSEPELWFRPDRALGRAHPGSIPDRPWFEIVPLGPDLTAKTREHNNTRDQKTAVEGFHHHISTLAARA